MGSHKKPNGFHPIKYPAAFVDNTIYQLAAFTHLALCIGVRIDGQVFLFIGAFDIGI